MSKNWNGIVDDILDQTNDHRATAVKKRFDLLTNSLAARRDADNLATLTVVTQSTFGDGKGGTRRKQMANLLNVIVPMSKALSERLALMEKLALEIGLGERHADR